MVPAVFPQSTLPRVGVPAAPAVRLCEAVRACCLPARPPLLQHKEEVHRGQLSSFGIPADLAAQPMYTLSGGG